MRINTYPKLLHGTSKTIGSMIRGFKLGTVKWFKENTDFRDVWQRNYYEHVIRNDDDLIEIRANILNNPLNWSKDTLNNTIY